MKKTVKAIAILLVASVLFASCATIAGGPVTQAQRTKPAPGQPARQVRTGALVCDILFWGGLGLIVDFATNAIYKPEPKKR